MNDIKPLVVVLDDRHNGKYSGGKWTAWNMCYVPSKIFADEKECADFFAKESLIFGRGETPEEAIEDLKHRLVYGTHMTKEYIKEVSESTEDEEDNKMKATSTETFHDIIAIDFELQTFPSTGEQDKFIVTARNRDDIFVFEFNGPCLVEACRKAGLLTGWEKNQKIRKLEKENKQNKELADAWSNEYYYLSKKFDKLQEENENLKQLKTPTIENFADEEPHSRRDILRCAEKCVCGQREQDYGTPESNFQLIADLWNDYLKKEQSSVVVDAMDVSMMMALLKIARIRNGGGSGDSFVDLAGYAACGGEIWAEQKHHKDQI